ncbi:expressed unknown protein [Seminavis robusta]|uniref:Uncharacterized protein n=1 Tax=Seminavis robusta TaxID=568900 RepID=A0A9N8EF37_9STRA|nr:expressed unknown protein [Seminavis robusta]|eukprot:Sro907_g218790.1 n/a (158) ;mRNA; r:31736-32209
MGSMAISKGVSFLFPRANRLRLRESTWWLHEPTDTLFRRKANDTRTQFSRSPRRSQVPKYHAPIPFQDDTIPSTCKRVSVHSTQTAQYVSLLCSSFTSEILLPPPQDLPCTLEALHKATQALQLTDNGSTIAQAITHGARKKPPHRQVRPDQMAAVF